MRYWKFLCDHRLPGPAGVRGRGGRLPCLVRSIAGSLLALTMAGGGLPAPAHAAWQLDPWLALYSGHESDLVLEPGPDPLVVPGGTFFDLSPGARLTGPLGRDSWLSLAGRIDLQQFRNEADRRLVGGSLAGDLVQRATGPVELRLSLGGSGFEDSEHPTANRLAGGGELALGLRTARWRLETIGGLQGRTYPDLVTLDDAGIGGTYSEVTTSAGLRSQYLPTRNLFLETWAVRSWTDGRDPLFDSAAWLVSAATSLRMGRNAWLLLSVLQQKRRFDERAAELDEDSYLRISAGMELPLRRGLALDARYSRDRYTRSDGSRLDVHRLAAGLTWRFGTAAAKGWQAVQEPRIPGRPGEPGTLTALEMTVGAPLDQPRENEPITLRLHAPAASAVSVVGDFNGWDPQAHRLRKAGSGWWEIDLQLAAGSYEYVFLVDGQPVVPPEADATVADGFGGRNGLLQVLPARP
jgi:hypothetical protein